MKTVITHLNFKPLTNLKICSEQERCKHRERVRCVNLGERVMQTKPIQQRTSLKKIKMSPRLAARDTARRRSRAQPGLTTVAQAARDTALHFGRSRAQPGGALTRPDSSRSESDTVLRNFLRGFRTGPRRSPLSGGQGRSYRFFRKCGRSVNFEPDSQTNYEIHRKKFLSISGLE